MPPLTRWFIRAALAYLVLALCVGVFLTLPTGNPISGLFPVYFHLLTFGWLTQLIFGVALWIFPTYSNAKPRGHEWLGWGTHSSFSTQACFCTQSLNRLIATIL